MKLCAVSVDLDEIPNYFQIHGLAPGAAATLVYDVAVPRLRTMAKDAALPLTLFTIASDMHRKEAADELRRAHGEGAEIANHSLDHRYDLTRLSRVEIEAQVEDAARLLEATVGEKPVGFRAPGYTITDRVFRVLEDAGVRYDSSVFPCPAYYGAKFAAIGAIRARGRASRSVVDDPRVLTAPTVPYRVATPYYRRGHGMLELPIQVTRGARLPFIGTTITLAGADKAKLLTKMCLGAELVNLELHGIDVLAARDGLEALAPHQVDVRVPLGVKLDALHATYETLKRAGYTFVTLREAAEVFAKRLS